MALQVIYGSTDQDLTTTGALKAEVLGATATSTAQDQFFSDKIRSASKAVQNYLGYPTPVATYRETVAGYGGRRIMLSRTPVRAVVAVFDATDTGVADQLTSTEYLIEDECAGLLARDRGFVWSATMQGRVGAAAYGGDAFPLDPWPAANQEYRPWLVEYVAGWSYAGIDPAASQNWATCGVLGNEATSTGRTLPEDIEQAAIFKAHTFVDGGYEVSSEKLADIETNYRSMGTDKNGREMDRMSLLLDSYARIA